VKDYKAIHNTHKTDDAGMARVELPKTYFIVRLRARKRPLVAMRASWEEDELGRGKTMPKEYTFRLESGITLGGRVRDEQGKPLVGAEVPAGSKPANSDGRASYTIGHNPVTTDADGGWRIDGVPNNAEDIVGVSVSHPE